MVGALPRAEPLEPRAPRREPELGAELRGPVAVASVVPVAETGDFRYTTELPKESSQDVVPHERDFRTLNGAHLRFLASYQLT